LLSATFFLWSRAQRLRLAFLLLDAFGDLHAWGRVLEIEQIVQLVNAVGLISCVLVIVVLCLSSVGYAMDKLLLFLIFGCDDCFGLCAFWRWLGKGSQELPFSCFFSKCLLLKVFLRGIKFSSHYSLVAYFLFSLGTSPYFLDEEFFYQTVNFASAMLY
jgi:hypothetical protein